MIDWEWYFGIFLMGIWEFVRGILYGGGMVIRCVVVIGVSLGIGVVMVCVFCVCGWDVVGVVWCED